MWFNLVAFKPEYSVRSTRVGQYHGCWCSGSLCRQDINSHEIEYAGYRGPPLPEGMISTVCIISVSRENANTHMYILLKKNQHNNNSWTLNSLKPSVASLHWWNGWLLLMHSEHNTCINHFRQDCWISRDLAVLPEVSNIMFFKTFSNLAGSHQYNADYVMSCVLFLFVFSLVVLGLEVAVQWRGRANTREMTAIGTDRRTDTRTDRTIATMTDRTIATMTDRTIATMTDRTIATMTGSVTNTVTNIIMSAAVNTTETEVVRERLTGRNIEIEIEIAIRMYKFCCI